MTKKKQEVVEHFSDRDQYGQICDIVYKGDLIRDVERLEFYGDPMKAIEKIQMFIATHTDSTMDDEYVYGSYGDSDRVYPVIKGWRPATPSELARRDGLRREKEDEQKVWKQKQIEQAKQLLKDAGEL